MRSERLHVVSSCRPAADALSCLLTDLPPEWNRDVVGGDISGWLTMIESPKGRPSRLQLEGLPERLRLELTWMAHWQSRDGSKVAVSGFNQIAEMLRWALDEGRATVSLTEFDQQTLIQLYRVHFATRRGRLPSAAMGERFQRLIGYPWIALTARLTDRPWWTLDHWHPRCDPRIPTRDREPRRMQGCQPGRLTIPWLRDAVKWHLATMLESGTLTWTTVSSDRLSSMILIDQWLATLDNPADIAREGPSAATLASRCRQWASDPSNHLRPGANGRVSIRAVNDSLRSVSALMDFIVDHRDECREAIGPTPWDQLTDAHPAIWRRQLITERGTAVINDDHYVDDHALAQITAALPSLGERSPQVMRMLLLQILTGRRASEICQCEFDCLSPVHNTELAQEQQVTRFRYAQSKIDAAPDSILVDAEVVAVIEEQQTWVRTQFPKIEPRYLFLQERSNAHGTKHISPGSYGCVLHSFSETVDITDSKGKPVELSRTHRFRHTRIICTGKGRVSYVSSAA